jgi:hypothetical protein
MKEVLSMRGMFSKLPFLTLVFAFIVLCSISSASAEKMKITGNNKSERIISQSSANAGDAPGHMMIQTVTLGSTTSSNVEWNNVPMMDTQHMDQSGESGKHEGYGYHTHKNGDQSFFKYWGTQKSAGEGKMAMDGKFEWTGGTGKFKSIKGGGAYTCTGTVTHSSCDWQGEVEY